MKKLLFLCALFYACVFCFSQITKDSVIFLKSDNLLIYPEFDKNYCSTEGSYSKKYEKKNLLFVSDFFECTKYSTSKKFIEVFFNGKKNYLEYKTDSNFFMVGGKEKSADEIFKYFRNVSKPDKDSLSHYSQLFSEVYFDKLKKDALENFKNETKNVIGILDAIPTEQYSFTGAKFRILNYSKKTIKYITFNFYGKNAVDDKVGASLSRKGIGPVEQYEEGAWNFENVWLTDIVERLKLTSVNIIYMDGSTKLLPITTNNWVIEEDYERLKNLLED